MKHPPRTRTLRSAADFRERDFPGYHFNHERFKIRKIAPTGKMGPELRAIRRTPRSKSITYYFRLLDRFGDYVYIHARAVFPGFSSPPPREGPSLEDYPDYHIDTNGDAFRYMSRKGKTFMHTMKSYDNKGVTTFRLKDREGMYRGISKETLRRLANGISLKRHPTAFPARELPKGAQEFTEFCDYAFHVDGRIFRTRFPVPDQEAREVRHNDRGVFYIYNSLGEKVGFTPEDVIRKCGGHVDE
jgi:hypothetical protein